MTNKISLTEGALPFVQELINNADDLKIKISNEHEATIIDCGINAQGSKEAAMLFINISLGGLAVVKYEENKQELDAIKIETEEPVLATLGCQAASWNVSKEGFFGMVCGPGRALAQKPSKTYKLIEYSEEHEKAILCIESDKKPTEEVINYLAKKCNVKKKNLVLLVIKTASIVSYIQMAARAIELGMFRLIEQLGYNKDVILKAKGMGLIAPFSSDSERSNDRINNALIYGTKLTLKVKSEEEDNLETLIPKIPSKYSKKYGKSFLEVFNEADQDFANFDLSLLSPTEIKIIDIRTNKEYSEGKLEPDRIIK